MEGYVPLLGVLFQYARSQKWKDYIIGPLVLAACVGAWWLGGGSLATREGWGEHGVLGLFLMTVGVSQVVSMGANVAVKLGANPEHPLIPVTNNK